MRKAPVCAALLLAATAAAAAQSADPRPNVVLIVADDLGYGELGCQGNREIPTPNIDSIARVGVRFTAAYVTAPVCSPSRAGMLTGRYQTRFGHELNLIGRQNLDPRAGLPLSETTLADRLRRAGYATGLVGKWHLGASSAFQPERRGFSEFFGFLHEGHFYGPPPYRGLVSFLRIRELPPELGGRKQEGSITWSTHLPTDEPPYDADNPILRGATPVDEPEYLTDAWTREAVAFIERHRKQPFFLYLAHNAPHSPMQARELDVERFARIGALQRRIFAAMLGRLDDGVGAVISKLRSAGLERRTLVVFLSDNGGPTAELTSSNRPLRGGKGQLFEAGIRVPFLMQWKGRFPAGKLYGAPVSALDIAATSLAAAGLAADDLDGVDLAPFISGKRAGTPHPILYWRYGAASAIREGDWKLVRQPERGAAARLQLFDLGRDPGETIDLAAREPGVVDRLESAWRAWNGAMVPPLWGGPARRGP